MGLIAVIDSAIKKIIFSIFWWLMDPLEPERLFSQLTDQLERNLDPNNPERLLAADNFDVVVNNKVFIKHAHSIAKLEKRTRISILFLDRVAEEIIWSFIRGCESP